MAWVNRTIKDALNAKDDAIITGSDAMLKILGEVKDQIIIELTHLPESGFESYRLKQVLASIKEQLNNFAASGQKELSGLLDDAWGMGTGMVDSVMKESGIYFGFRLSTSTLNRLKEFAMHRIEDLSMDAFAKVRGEISLGVLGQKTPWEVAQSISGELPGPSIFGSIENRADVITRTEMGRIYSTATQDRMEQAAGYVPGMEKQWLHKGHPKKPREMHMLADGNHVPVDKPFSIGGVSMMYPRDPAAPIGEVINCGCDHVPYMAKWAA
jgi:hypothetical protein